MASARATASAGVSPGTGARTPPGSVLVLVMALALLVACLYTLLGGSRQRGTEPAPEVLGDLGDRAVVERVGVVLQVARDPAGAQDLQRPRASVGNARTSLLRQPPVANRGADGLA